MGKKTLITVDSTYREAKTGFLTVDGIYRKIKKGFITSGGVWKEFFSGGVDVAAMAISYSGNHTDQVVTMGDGKKYRLLTLTSSGILTLEEEVSADVWLCYGGGNGASYNGNVGGAGGSGGIFCNETATLPKTSTITIAAAGGASNISGVNLSNWLTGAGGGGGANGGSKVYGTGGVKAGGDTRPFQDSYFTSYPCAGGGGGGSANSKSGSNYSGGNGGSSTGAGANGSGYSYSNGGVTGGGRGAYLSGGATAATYYGSGGGGGQGSSYEYGGGKSGYQGLCVIRIPLEQ